MGVFDKYADAPNQIKKEGQEITIRFQRTGPTTGRISWNIPAPSAGCTAETQAYDGIVITVNSKPSNYLSNAPKNGTFYNGDATGDADLHAGDKLDGALVLAALYSDRTTTYIDVNDILPKTAYYVSGYAVDAQARYHREGVHAYSLPTGSDEWGLPDKVAKHDIIINVQGGVSGSTETGLVIDTQYTLKLLIDKKEYSVVVDGENVTTYNDLVSELKEKLAHLGDVFISPISPNTNVLYYNSDTKELKRWDGDSYIDLHALSHPTDPEDKSPTDLWFNLSASALFQRNADDTVWEAAAPYISAAVNPKELACDQAWYDGMNVWLFKTTHWEKLYTYKQTRNPLLAPLLTCDDYWYNSTDGTVSVWDVDAKKWNAVNVIYFDSDPNALAESAFWYDETAKKVKHLTAGVWVELVSVTYLDTLPTDPADYTTVANTQDYIFAKDTQSLLHYDGSEWVEVAIVAFTSNPMDRSKSILWWNSTSGVDTLFAWDAATEVWVNVTSFTQSETNPALPAPVVENSAWVNTANGEIKLVFKTSCRKIYPITFVIPGGGSPGDIPVGTLWNDTSDDTWHSWDGVGFMQVFPYYFKTDPYNVISGFYWFDTTNNVLNRWTVPTSGSPFWEALEYQAKPVKNTVGSFWFDSVNDTLFMWDGKAWIESTGMASVELVQPETSSGRTVLSFFTRDVGCATSIEVVSDAGLLLSQLTQSVIYLEPMDGESGRVGGASYNQLGVGDDGSPDERRKLHDDIRSMLGHPVVQVELTKEQLDICINLALMELRKFSSYSVKRGVFFLDLRPNQQTYLLTNKCIGFNKVTNVNSIHRSRGMALSPASIDNDAFTYAAIQRLYSMGTFDMLSYHLVTAYMEEMETIFANRIMFNWIEQERELSLFSRITRKERVLVDAFFERTEQELMIDRHTGLWLQRWALAEAKMMLAIGARGKFQTLPGPNGSTTLNSSDLQQQAQDEMKSLREQLEDYSMQNLGAIGLRAHFILG